MCQPKVWVKSPETVSVEPAPTVKLPLLLKSPVVAKVAPLVTVKPPLFEVKPAMPVIDAPAPSSVGLPALLVMAVPVGNWSAVRMNGVPVLALRPRGRNLRDGIGIQEEGPRFRLDDAAVVEAAIDGQVRSSTAPRFDDGPLIDDGSLATEYIIDTRIGLDDVRRAGFDFENCGGDVIAVQIDAACARLDDMVPKLSRVASSKKSLSAEPARFMVPRLVTSPLEANITPPVH